MPKRKDTDVKKTASTINAAFDIDADRAAKQPGAKTTTEDEGFTRINISVPVAFLNKLDTYLKEAKSRGSSTNRSSYLVQAALDKMNQE